ncbi:hypothetical protein L1887_03382 [Cichorium endivia]|nr:hypothetical protein L1887_03382 [Cichorium endivia]
MDNDVKFGAISQRILFHPIDYVTPPSPLSTTVATTDNRQHPLYVCSESNKIAKVAELQSPERSIGVAGFFNLSGGSSPFPLTVSLINNMS